MLLWQVYFETPVDFFCQSFNILLIFYTKIGKIIFLISPITQTKHSKRVKKRRKLHTVLLSLEALQIDF